MPLLGTFIFLKWQTLQLMSIINYDCLILGKNVVTLWKELNKIRTHFQWISWALKSPNYCIETDDYNSYTAISWTFTYNIKYKQCTAHTVPLACFMYVSTTTFSIGSISTALLKKTAEKQLTFWTDSKMSAIPLSWNCTHFRHPTDEQLWL